MTIRRNRPLRALVIEDEPDVRHLLAGHLTRLGYRVVSAQTGERGVALAVTDPPDVVLVDMMLPGIDGREVVRRLRSERRTANCAIIACSVLDPADLAGVDADLVLTKPFRKAALLQTLHNVTSRDEA